jgi:hypothetical protein
LHEGVLLSDEPPHQLLWNKKAKIKIRRGNFYTEKEVSNYPQRLPKVLQQLGLDPAINRIEIEEETLETVVLEMIHAHEKEIKAGGEQ